MQTMHSDPAVILQDELPGVASPAALRSMAPAEVFARHLASYALDHQISMAQRYTNLPPHVIDRVRTEPWPVPGYVRLATFSDGDRLGYIVFRRDFSHRSDDADESQGAPGWAEYSAEEQQLAMDLSRGFPEFAPCYKQGDGTWRLIARHGFLGQGSFAFAFDEGTDQGTASE
jgi:hypothetical protein